VRRSRLRVLATVAVALASSACAAVAPAGPPAPLPVDTLFYVSARTAHGFGDPRRHADSLEFGLIVTERREPADPTEDELPFDIVDSIPLPVDRFVALLADRTPDDGFAVLYTHGFGTEAREGWQQAADARTRSLGTQPWVAFSWPAGDTWIARPWNGHYLASGYRQDSASAVTSREPFLRALGVLRGAIGSGRLLLFTHSMGAQVVAEALAADAPMRAELAADPLRGVAFYAADIEADRFANVLVDSVRPLARRVVLYASAEDRALRASEMISDTRRAGHIHRGDTLPLLRDGLESIDISEAPNASGFWRWLLGARHGVRHASGVVFDLVQVVGEGRVAECREEVGTARRLAPTAWKLNTGTLPPPAAVHRCPVLPFLQQSP
jgi:esterase/lipase superfamily enzyme